MGSAVVDANVFIRGKTNLDFDQFYTVPEVTRELRSDRSQMNFDVKDVEVENPSEESLEEVSKKSVEVGAATSGTDEKLLALAMDMGAVLVTDDMDLQNLALHLGVAYSSYMGDEVEEKRSWIRICENCGAKVEGEKCSRCGSTRVERKPDRCS